MRHKNHIPVLWMANVEVTEAFHNIKNFTEPSFVKKYALSLVCFTFAIFWLFSIQSRPTVVSLKPDLIVHCLYQLQMQCHCLFEIHLANIRHRSGVNFILVIFITISTNIMNTRTYTVLIYWKVLYQLQRLWGYIHTQQENYEWRTESRVFVWTNRKIMSM